MSALRGICAIVVSAIGAGCSDGGLGPNGTDCPAATSAVQATVTSGSSVVFDWTPGCAVALVLIEEEAHDKWGIAAPGLSDMSTESANIISPPVTYGVVPSEADEIAPPEELIAGRTYELVLWRIVPAGSTVVCQQRFENACLLTIQVFVR